MDRTNNDGWLVRRQDRLHTSQTFGAAHSRLSIAGCSHSVFYSALLMQMLAAKAPVWPDAECLFEPKAKEHTPVATAHSDEPE